MTKKRGKPGIDPIEVDWAQVKKLAAIHCTRNEIASFLDISHDTLERSSKRDYDRTIGSLLEEWRDGGKCSLRRKQWVLAEKNAAMAIFLGKQLLGQRDDIRLNHSGAVVQEIVHFGDEEPKKWEDEIKE
jgi:hypothetical protein